MQCGRERSSSETSTQQTQEPDHCRSGKMRSAQVVKSLKNTGVHQLLQQQVPRPGEGLQPPLQGGAGECDRYVDPESNNSKKSSKPVNQPITASLPIPGDAVGTPFCSLPCLDLPSATEIKCCLFKTTFPLEGHRRLINSSSCGTHPVTRTTAFLNMEAQA